MSPSQRQPLNVLAAKSHAGDTVVLRWDSVPGRRYRVERSNGDPGNWTVSVRGLLADSTTLTHTDLRIDNSRPVFYRLVVEMD